MAQPCSALLGLALLLALLLLRSTAASCPNQCYRQGACTRGACSCYRGFAGLDCVHKLEHEGSGMPAYSELDDWSAEHHSQMRIAVASAQVLGATFYDDLDVVIPGLTVARQLAAQRHHVVLIFCLHEQKELELRYVWQKALMEEGIQLEVIYHTQHYYLPANLAHSFETYAWISDWVQTSGRPFDIVYFHDGHGLAYFSALAKHQDIPDCGLRDSLLVMGTQLPLLWLTTKGGGGGLKNVDELEINFIEHESARLVDHVVTPSRFLDQWMADRNWRLPWTTYALPQPLPQKEIDHLKLGLAAPAPEKPASGRRQFVFVIEGPGSGVLGKSVSSGKNANSPLSREVTKAEAEDLDRFEHVSSDTLVACEVATKVAGMLEDEDLASVAFTFFLLGVNAGTEPHAARQIQYFARTRKWNFTWAVARGSSSQAVEHAAAPGAVVLLQAARFRGSTTPLLVRRVVSAQNLERQRAEALQRGDAKSAPGAVISASGDAAEFLKGFVAAEDTGASLAGAFAGIDTDEIMHRMLDAFHGTGQRLVPAIDEIEIAAASATWLNFLPWHTRHIRQEIYSYDGTAERLFMEFQHPEAAQGGGEAYGSQRSAHAAEDSIVITKTDGPKLSLKGDPLVGMAMQSGSSPEPEQVGWRSETASRRATKVARWSAQQLGVALEEVNNTASGTGFKAPKLRYEQSFPPYRQPLVTVVITHYNRPKLLPLAVRSVAEQTYPNIQLVVVDDGSPNKDVPEALDELEAKYQFKQRGWAMLREPNRYLGGARNRGVREAAGEYILFMDDDNVAKPFEVEYFVQAMESTGADILTSFVDFVHGDTYPQLPSVRVNMASQNPLPEGFAPSYRRSPSFVFLGGSADVGIFKNCFGDANSFFRKSTFLKMGGYSEDRGIGYEDWELYSRAALKGYNLMVMAKSLYWYRFVAGSMQKTTSYSRSRQRALRAYIEALHDKRELGLAALAREQEGNSYGCDVDGSGSGQCRA